MEIEAKACHCGAITIYTDEGNFSMPNRMFNEKFANNPEYRVQFLEGMFINCNYCINHWGLDLCGCGSGEKVGNCKEGYTECRNNIPSQIFPDKLCP